MSFKKDLQLCREFGVKVMFSDLFAKNIRLPRITSRWKDRVILQWLRDHYGQVLEKYRHSAPPQTRQAAQSLPVWSMWLQGEQNAPELVKMCLESTRTHCGSHQFHVITRENLNEYISLPGYILDKLSGGEITLTHFSDIVRVYLLSHYGGLWIDATVLTAKDIPESVFEAEYFTIKHELDLNCRNAALQRWTGYLQSAQKHNRLCSFALDIFLEYWKTHTMLIDYVLMDYVIALAYEDIPECRKLIDSVPLNNPRVEDMMPLMNSAYDSEVYDDLTRETRFFKLTYKQEVQKSIAGRKTLYARLLEC